VASEVAAAAAGGAGAAAPALISPAANAANAAAAQLSWKCKVKQFIHCKPDTAALEIGDSFRFSHTLPYFFRKKCFASR
jgi:hypothetical protein